MRQIVNNIIPFKGFLAVNIFGVLFVRKEYANRVTATVLNHEAIHTAQMRELWYVPFYLIYFCEWVVRLFIESDAYRSISFEQEAYNNQSNINYLSERKHFAQWRKTK